MHDYKEVRLYISGVLLSQVQVTLSLIAVTESPIGIYITISSNEEDGDENTIVVCNSAETAQTHFKEVRLSVFSQFYIVV